jgi:DNA-binding MarR family transcriptional regulator
MAATPSHPSPELDREEPGDLGIVDALAQLSFLLQAMLAREAAAFDLSMVQTRLLGVLRDRHPTMQELARLLELDKSSVTGLVDRAEKRGLVRRTPSEDDRRAIRVALTPSGRRIIDQAGNAFEADVTSVTACLSPTDQKHLSTLASRIVSRYAGERLLPEEMAGRVDATPRPTPRRP